MAIRTCLFVTPMLPARKDTGALIYSQMVIDLLRREGIDVTVLGWREAGTPDALGQGEIAVGTRAFISRHHPLSSARWLARALIRREPYTLAKFRSGAFDRQVAKRSRCCDLIVLDRQLDWAIDLVPANLPLVHVSHEIASTVYADSRAPLLRREAQRLRASERRIAVRADQIWTIAPDDADHYRSMGARNALHLPYTPDPYPARALAPTNDVVLLGTWTWSPNRIGLHWFLDQVVPLLPGLTFAIGGRGAEAFARPGVSAVGWVNDDAAFLRSGRVIAIPSLAGVGVQTKSLRAMVLGPSVVATPHAMRHIEERPRHLAVAATPKAFAAAIRAGLSTAPTSGTDPFEARRAGLHAQLRAALAQLGYPPP